LRIREVLTSGKADDDLAFDIEHLIELAQERAWQL
jgi:hypothetical protein